MSRARRSATAQPQQNLHAAGTSNGIDVPVGRRSRQLAASSGLNLYVLLYCTYALSREKRGLRRREGTWIEVTLSGASGPSADDTRWAEECRNGLPAGLRICRSALWRMAHQLCLLLNPYSYLFCLRVIGRFPPCPACHQVIPVVYRLIGRRLRLLVPPARA